MHLAVWEKTGQISLFSADRSHNAPLNNSLPKETEKNISHEHSELTGILSSQENGISGNQEYNIFVKICSVCADLLFPTDLIVLRFEYIP